MQDLVTSVSFSIHFEDTLTNAHKFAHKFSKDFLLISPQKQKFAGKCFMHIKQQSTTLFMQILFPHQTKARFIWLMNDTDKLFIIGERRRCHG